MATNPNTELRRIAMYCLQGILAADDYSLDAAERAIRYAKKLQHQLDIEAPVGRHDGGVEL